MTTVPTDPAAVFDAGVAMEAIIVVSVWGTSSPRARHCPALVILDGINGDRAPQLRRKGRLGRRPGESTRVNVRSKRPTAWYRVGDDEGGALEAREARAEGERPPERRGAKGPRKRRRKGVWGTKSTR